MTLEDLEKIVNDKIAFQGNEKFEKYTELTDKYLALTGITQLAGGKTIEELLEDADDEEKETIIGKLAWCIPGGKGMGGDDSGPKSEVDPEIDPTPDPENGHNLNNLEDAENAVLTIQDAIEHGSITAQSDPEFDLNNDGKIDEKDLVIAKEAVRRLKGEEPVDDDI